MVVIVIRVPPRDSGEDKHSGTPTVTYRTDGAGRVTVSKTRNGTYGERDAFHETGPSSYDSGVNTDPETRDLKLFLRENRTVYDKIPCRSPRDEDRLLSHLESCSKDSGFCGHVEYQRLRDLELLKEIHERSKNEIRLESPVSKDSGFSDKARKPFQGKHFSRPESREKSTSCTYLSSRSSQPDTDSNTVTYLSCSSQADPENSVATTKEGKYSSFFSHVD